jgi:hypothetical protein
MFLRGCLRTKPDAVRKVRAGEQRVRASAWLLLHAQAQSRSAARVLPIQQAQLADNFFGKGLSLMLDMTIELCQGGSCS